MVLNFGPFNQSINFFLIHSLTWAEKLGKCGRLCGM
jgi:hypothetical protein